VIHCSERDTQITDRPKQVDEFVNTWSIEGFREEGTTTAEMGWARTRRSCRGSPTATKPARATRFASRVWHEHLGRRGCRIIAFRHGCPPRRGVHHLRQAHGVEKGKAVYRPTVHYAYCPCDSAIASLNELRGYDYASSSSSAS